MKAKAKKFIINSIFSVKNRFNQETPTSNNTPATQLLNKHQNLNITSRNSKGWKEKNYHNQNHNLTNAISDLAKTAHFTGRNNQTPHVIPSAIRKKGNTNPILPLYKKYTT